MTNTNTINSALNNNNSNGLVSCPSCNSHHIQKRGFSKTGRRLSCFDCGKNFTRTWEELEGTRFAKEDSDNDMDTKSTLSSSASNITDNTEEVTSINDEEEINNNEEIISLDEEGKTELIISRAKRDVNGNFLLKVNGNAPVPIGSTADELKNIIRQNGGCKMSMTREGIFILTVATTTKGC